jgi:hypothetical protein
VSTLIATSELSDAKVSQWVDLRSKTQWLWGITYQLSTPVQNNQVWNTSEPNLADIQNEIYDFDANASIVETEDLQTKTSG